MSDTQTSETQTAAELKEACHRALEELRACQESEQSEYGGDYQEVKKMESEAPAPSPCVDQYNAAIEALLAYGGDLDDFEFGRFEDSIKASLNAKRA